MLLKCPLISMYCYFFCLSATLNDITFKRIGNQPNGYYFIYILDNTLTAQLFLSQMDDKRGFFQEL